MQLSPGASVSSVHPCCLLYLTLTDADVLAMFQFVIQKL